MLVIDLKFGVVGFSYLYYVVYPPIQLLCGFHTNLVFPWSLDVGHYYDTRVGDNVFF